MKSGKERGVRSRLRALMPCLCMMLITPSLPGTVYEVDNKFTVDGIHYVVTREEAPGGEGKPEKPGKPGKPGRPAQNTVTVKGGSPDANGKLTIPGNVTGNPDSPGTVYIVNSIEDNAFSRISGITKLELPQSGSLSIGESAFEGTGLSGTLTIPSSVISIGRKTFWGLSDITKLVLPESGSLYIGKSAFGGTGLSGTLTIPAGVASIDEDAFWGLGSITKLELPQSGSLSITALAC